jgi:hypothetical protein
MESITAKKSTRLKSRIARISQGRQIAIVLLKARLVAECFFASDIIMTSAGNPRTREEHILANERNLFHLLQYASLESSGSRNFSEAMN